MSDLTRRSETQAYLVRRKPNENMHRFYLLFIQEDLFGEWIVVREWGRVGFAGKVMRMAYSNKDEAVRELNNILNKKLKRGYLCRNSVC